jgi:hypothetical protein
MLTNPFETQMVRSLGVKVGGPPAASPEPFQHLRGAMANPHLDTLDAPAEVADGATAGGSGCPFAAMLNETAAPASVVWTSEAEARMERVPSFIRPMARKAIERFAEGKGYPVITDEVMDEARGAIGM